LAKPPSNPAAKPVRKRPASAGPTASIETSLKKITPARLAAFEILTLVGQNKGHSDELLHSDRVDALSPEDRNLTTTLVMGVLRWQIALDARIRTLLQRPDQRLADSVAIALRLGAFQLSHLNRIPAHAALSESVELCRAAGEPHATGMVNAILRKIAAAQKPGTRIHESVAAFAERLAHPRWLVERWANTYGREAALKICEADQQEPAEGAIFTPDPDLPNMDDGSRLVAELTAAAKPDTQKIWDCCAAPGGKTLILAHRLPEAHILATDVSTKRLARLEARLSRYTYAGNVECAVADASTYTGTATSVDDQLFDLILCDVPCTGTGTLARNPEIRLRLKAEELTRQAERQRAILTGALKHLAPGGRLVYSTCSLEPEECEHVVAAVTAKQNLHQIPIDPLMAHLRTSVDLSSTLREGTLRTLPGVHPCDGFYATILERP
jgi:16S rRNA (cytosine967-C5)-methyltransferase